MASRAALLTRPGEVVRIASGAPPARPSGAGARPDGVRRKLAVWLRSQAVNAVRAALLIRPFAPGEFGTGAASPSKVHIGAANRLMTQLRSLVIRNARQQQAASRAAVRAPSRVPLDRAARVKEEGTAIVATTERFWEFYWHIFGQRQTTIAPRLLAADRIALDCYQYTYGGLGKARSIPSPAPFSYMESGLGPATFRRGVRVSRLGRLPNPFPLVKLPYHRLVCPWTLGAIPHEVAHNLQADLGLWLAIPKVVYQRLRQAGVPAEVARVWMRWHKEIFADLLGVLLIGPAFIGSLMDVVGKSPELVAAFSPKGVHPTPYLRVLIDLELLQRMRFAEEARAFRRAWLALYPPSRAQGMPEALRRSFVPACRLVVEIMCFTAWPQLGNKALAEVVAFRPQDQAVVREAAGRLAKGEDPGIVPERFLIAATRHAVDHKLAPPHVISRHFYQALGRR
jgi:hypothetical protein